MTWYYKPKRSKFRKYKMYKRGKKNRKNPTPQEEKAWEFISQIRKNDNHGNVFFYRQSYMPILGKEYFLDFYCPKLKLAVEIDGDYHLTEEQMKKDYFRDSRLEKLGIKVLRFSNDEVEQTPEKVKEQIEVYFEGRYALATSN